jgi:hypothetical protein
MTKFADQTSGFLNQFCYNNPVFPNEAPRPQGGASRARSGEPEASKGNFVYIVPLAPTYKAGLAGHLPASPETGKWTNSSFQERNTRFREE